MMVKPSRMPDSPLAKVTAGTPYPPASMVVLSTPSTPVTVMFLPEKSMAS
jgi:hypothetical protein